MLDKPGACISEKSKATIAKTEENIFEGSPFV